MQFKFFAGYSMLLGFQLNITIYYMFYTVIYTSYKCQQANEI